MEWLDILQQVVNVCVIPLLGLATAYFIKWIKAKEQEILVKVDNDTADKYISMVAQTITDCVIATNQTYVEALKKDNAFTKEAQKEAFQRTLDAVLAVLSDDAKEYLATLYGDATAYLTTRIEAEVNLQK
jgi:hypothetical protein